jgi:hypothetical protein
MAARSARQLATRQKNLTDYPLILPAACPQCGGFEWSITDARVEPTISQTSFWQTLRRRIMARRP